MRRYAPVLSSLLLIFALVLTACAPTAPAGAPPAADAQATDAPAAAAPAADDAASEGKTKIVWYIGLGAGSQPEAVEKENAFVAEFNRNHPTIELETIIVPNQQAQQQLATMIAGGNSPDIIGPVGVGGRAGFTDQLLDLSPYIEEMNVDLSQYESALVQFYDVPGQGQIGLPFGVFPMVVMYNKDLFDEAGLPYPPAAYGEQYEGKEWNWETFTELAKKLTVDANGLDATQEGFDKDNVVQWGFNFQWGNDVANVGATWGNGSLVAEDGVTAQFPAAWQEGVQWYYDAMFKDGIAISNPQESAQEIGGNAFSAGRTAMTVTNTWYLCCLNPDVVQNFDFAPMPSNDGTVVSVLDADTFSILKGSQHPKEAFEVLMYFLTEGAPQLYDIYQPLPGLTANQQAFFDAQNEKWGTELNWDVVVESMKSPDIPSTESALPNNLESRQIVSEFNSRIFSTPGLDIAQELQGLVTALQASYDKAQ